MNDDPATILVIEDDAATATFLADNLTADGYEIHVADCASDAMRLLETKYPDVALVDVGLPDASGLEVLRRVRSADGLASRANPAIPMLVLSGRCEELDRIRAFQSGADDVLAKPFSYSELRLRIDALLRRLDLGRHTGVRMRVGDLQIDGASREVNLRGQRIELSQKEFALLRALASQPTRVWTKPELLSAVWGYKSIGATRTLDSHACRLRQKLALEGDRFVINVWGVGYRLVDPAPAEDPLRGEPAKRRARFAVAEPGMVA
jgi:DNA-binding response OmpR family regulator